MHGSRQPGIMIPQGAGTVHGQNITGKRHGLSSPAGLRETAERTVDGTKAGTERFSSCSEGSRQAGRARKKRVIAGEKPKAHYPETTECRTVCRYGGNCAGSNGAKSYPFLTSHVP